MFASAKFRGDLPNGLKVETHTYLVNFISYSLKGREFEHKFGGSDR
jgi:hypothetical protein